MTTQSDQKAHQAFKTAEAAANRQGFVNEGKLSFIAGYLEEALSQSYAENEMLQTRAELAAIHAANAVKRRKGPRASQDSAAIVAKNAVLSGKTGASAVELGYRFGMGMEISA